MADPIDLLALEAQQPEPFSQAILQGFGSFLKAREAGLERKKLEETLKLQKQKQTLAEDEADQQQENFMQEFLFQQQEAEAKRAPVDVGFIPGFAPGQEIDPRAVPAATAGGFQLEATRQRLVGSRSAKALEFARKKNPAPKFDAAAEVLNPGLFNRMQRENDERINRDAILFEAASDPKAGGLADILRQQGFKITPIGKPKPDAKGKRTPAQLLQDKIDARKKGK